MKCSVEGCDRDKSHSKLYCAMHYQRMKYTGTTDGGHRERLPLKQRFWKRVEKLDSGCWIWTGSKNVGGYGLVGSGGKGGKYLLTHRYSYTIHKGEIPQGMYVMHSCDNPSCVNPDHLSLGTPKDNTLDAKNKGRLSNGERPKKLSDEQVLFIKEHLEISGKDVAAMFNVSKAVVSSIRNGKQRTYVVTDVAYPGRRPKMKKVMPKMLGIDHPRSKMTEDQVRFIKAHPEINNKQISLMFGVSPNCIRLVRIGRTWTHI